MVKQYTFQPKGVCSREMRIAYEDNKIVSLEVIGGCHGNLQGIAALVKGMDIDEAIARLEGINCHGRGTSCPDQFSKALKEIKALN